MPVQMTLNGKLVAELWMNKPGLEWLIDRQEVEVLTNKPDLKLKFGKWVLSNHTKLRKSGTELAMEM